MLHKLLFVDILMNNHYRFTYETPHGMKGELFIGKEELASLGKPVEEVLRQHDIDVPYRFDSLVRINNEVLNSKDTYCLELENCGGLLW